VRPWLGALISIAQFRSLRELVIVDTSSEEPPRRGIKIPIPPEEWDKAVWDDIDKAFRQPVARDDELSEYAPTQVIAEFFKAQEFDGIAYQSAFGGGHNVVLFDLAAAELVNCGLEKVRAVNFDFATAANPYFKKI
jgi:hypothetical protein